MKDAYHRAGTLGDMYIIESLSYSSIFFIKGQTIRKIMGGGGEEFLSRRNFF